MLLSQVVGEEERKNSTVNVRTRDNHVRSFPTMCQDNALG